MEQVYFYLMVASGLSSGFLMVAATSVPVWSSWMVQRKADRDVKVQTKRLSSLSSGSSCVAVPSANGVR